MRVATPCDGQQMAAHFGHAPQFAIFDTDPDSSSIKSEQFVDSPPHEPGLLPKWLAQQGTNVILAGGMGMRAKQLFEENGITVVVGVGGMAPKEAVEAYLKGTLSSGSNLCDH